MMIMERKPDHRKNDVTNCNSLVCCVRTCTNNNNNNNTYLLNIKETKRTNDTNKDGL